MPVEPFTLHVSQTFANQGTVTQASDGLHMTPHPSAVPPAPLSAPQAYAGLFMPPRPSAAPSLAPLALSASLAASGGAPLASTHSTLSPSYLCDPRLAPQSSAFPSYARWSSAGLQSQLSNLV